MVAWFFVGTTLGLGGAAGYWALRRRQPALVWASGLLIAVAGILARFSSLTGGYGSISAVLAFCFAAGAAIWTLLDTATHGGVPRYRLGQRSVRFAHLAVQAALVLLAWTVFRGLARVLRDEPQLVLHGADWFALSATIVALAATLWDRTARFSVAGLYAAVLIAVGMGQIHRGFAPARFLLWVAACDLAGLVLVAALIGWGWSQLAPTSGEFSGRWGSRLRIPESSCRWSAAWFRCAQALLAGTAAALTVWIAADLGFDGTGQGMALFGLAGRSAACPAALMLLGTAILMAWQNRGGWRAGWQYAALASGVLFTTSLGWATMDASTASPWLHRGGNLLISASMMTLMTGFGLGRVLPRHSDWIARGRRAMPVFAALALVLLMTLAACQR